jgi:excisionase family DNA binding protein
MPKSGEFYSFDEVLKRLKIDEQRLKKLVSEGEIRAFREGQEMKFRKSDIDNLDRTRPVAGSEDATAAIDLSAGGGGQPSETLTDDLIFDEGDDVGSKEAGMATAEISSQDTFVEEGVGMSTEPLEVEGEESSTMEVAPAGGKKGKGGKSAQAAKPRPTRAPVEEDEPTETGWCVAMALSAVVLVCAMFVSWDVAKSDRGTSQPNGFSKWVADTFGSGSSK